MKKILWKIESTWEKYHTPTPAGIDVSSQYYDGISKSWSTLVQRDVLSVELSEDPVFQDDYGAYPGLAQHQLLNVNGKPVYVFDNHNLALVALHELKESSRHIHPIVHIDAHRDDQVFKGNIDMGLVEVVEQSRISDFIDVAEKAGLVSKTMRAVSSDEFNNFTPPVEPYILTVDIDIFGPEGAHIDLETKVRVIAETWSGASAIICATSPGFIEQEFALDIIKIFLNSGKEV